MRKRIRGIILAVCTLLILTPDTVMAAKMEETSLPIQETAEQPTDGETAGSSSVMEGVGTETAPYRIKNAEQFCAFADMVNGVNGAPDTGLCAVLTCDIDLSGVCGADIGSWTPIGKNANPYTGIFDGGSFAITGLYYHKSNSSYAGLFGNNAGLIKNLGVAGADVAGGSYTGGVCGFNSGTITGCYNVVSVKGNDYTGGVCGYNDVGGTVNICYNMGAISGRKYVGGICGYNKNTTNDCYNMGSINGKRTSIGGICGYNRALVSNCFNTGAVNNGGRKYIGSICGYNHSQSSFLNCYYLITGEEKGNYGVAMTQEQFASGEVCWLLNDGRIENVVWHQTCGAGFPAFGGKVVYQVRRPKTGGSADEMIVAYTNEEEKKQASNNASAEGNDSDNTSNENTHGHVYQAPVWEWKEYKSAKAVFTCQDCGEKLSLDASISTKTTDATCGKEGKTVYTATVNRDGETYTNKKTVMLEKLAHKPLEKQSEVPAKCTESGSRACWRCPDCGKYFEDEDRKTELSQNKVVIPATGHKYSKPEWNWDVENNPLVAVAIFSCDNNCGTTEKENGKVTSETGAACASMGKIKYTAVVEFNRVTYKEERTVDGKPIPHSYGEDDPEWNWDLAKDPPTAAAVFTCKRCKEEAVSGPAQITSGEKTPSTCIEAGKIKYTAIVIFKGREYSDVKTKPLEKAEHDYGTGEPKWEWAADNKSATATFTCTVCQTPVSKTVKVTKKESSGTTCETPRKVVYTATVTFNETTYTKQKEEEIPATHTLGDPVAAKEPTCVEPGNKQYWECSVCYDWFSDSAGKTKVEKASISIPATGHKFEPVPEDANIYRCTTCNKRFSVTELPDGTTTIYSVEENTVILQDETENSEETEDTEPQSEDELAVEVSQGEPEGQNGESSQNEPEGQDEQNMQNEQDGQSGPNEDESSDSIPDVSENPERYGLIYPEGEGEKADSVTADALEGSVINLRAESAGKTAPQIVREQQQKQGYPLWVSVAVLSVLAGVVLVLLCKRKVVDDKR